MSGMKNRAEVYDAIAQVWLEFARACREKVENMTRVDENMRGEFWERIAVRCCRRAGFYAAMADKHRLVEIAASGTIRAVK